MKKTNIFVLLISLVGLGLFNVCAFLLITEYTKLFWTVYAFTTVAFIAQCVTAFAIRKSRSDMRFLSLPLISVGGTYFVVQIIADVICLTKTVPFALAVIIQSAILAIYIIVALSSSIAKEQIQDTDDGIKQATGYIRTLTVESEQLYMLQEDADKKAELKKLFESIRYSDPMSSTAEVRMVDEQINVAFRVLKQNIASMSADDLKTEVKPILDLIAKRNMLCKATK